MCSKRKLFEVILLCLFISLIACRGKTDNKEQDTIAETVHNNPRKRDIFDPDNCLSVSLLKETEKTILLGEEDSRFVLSYLSSAIYNDERNKSEKNFKMVAPDYTFLIEQKDGYKELAQLWKDESLLLLRTRWYIVPSQIDIFSRLEKYK